MLMCFFSIIIIYLPKKDKYFGIYNFLTVILIFLSPEINYKSRFGSLEFNFVEDASFFISIVDFEFGIKK